jgi:hypothetical protein
MAMSRVESAIAQNFSRYEQGEFKSVGDAAKSAGIIRDKTPLELLKSAWGKASKAEQHRFMMEISQS